MAHNTHSEYHDVLRVDVDATLLPPHGYRYFEADRYPLPALQYARDTTLARGRMLYEVWDYWRSMFIGYIVPSNIFNEALANREHPSLTSWGKLPSTIRNLHHHTHRVIIERFPRIPLLAAKLTTETLVRNRKTVPPFHIIEEAVIEHAKHRRTSYDFRISQGQTGEEAMNNVKSRMREVLQSWLPFAISWHNLVTVWRKHHLVEEGEGKNGQLFEENKVLLGMPMVVHWYAGAETNANLISASKLPPL